MDRGFKICLFALKSKTALSAEACWWTWLEKLLIVISEGSWFPKLYLRGGSKYLQLAASLYSRVKMLGVVSVFQHDEGANCGNLGSDVGKGRYLMFPYATDGARENNDKFSPCSIKHVSNILKLKKDDCFTGEEEISVSCILFTLCTSCCSLQAISVCVYLLMCLSACLFILGSQWSAHLWKPDHRGRWGVWCR